MYRARVEPEWDVDAWRALARSGLCADVEPAAIDWQADAQPGLLAAASLADALPRHASPHVRAGFVELAAAVLCHRDAQRQALLYRLLWRLTHGEPALLDRATDADVHRALMLRKAVQRDTHKMKAFVRFRAVPGEDEAFVAWFEPEHFIVDRVAPFFARRFAGMRWAILTPYRSVRWDGTSLVFGAGARRADAPADDARETLWRTYYANIFNPARTNPTMMQQEMPRRYWKHLPEAALIPDLLNTAPARVTEMIAREAQAPRRRVPARAPDTEPRAIEDLGTLAAALSRCRDCELWQPATRAVAGEGPPDARIVLIGEQPGDREDLSGRPFVGPAGQLLDRALAELGIARESLFLTNAVKHFRFEQRGKARLHKNPLRRHVEACSGWLAHELALVRPQRIVCLGATAAAAVFGTGFRLQDQRGTWRRLRNGTWAMATVHPAAILRADGDMAQTYAGFVADLRRLLDPPHSL